MKNILIYFLCLFFTINFVYTKEDNLKKALDFTSLEVVTKKELKLSNYYGKVIILNFFASWCPPCKKEIPDFIKLYNKYHKQGLEIIGIALDEEKNIKSFIKKMKINYPVIIGNNKITSDYQGISGIPTTFIIDKKGYIREKYVGFVSYEIFENIIKKISSEKE